MHAQMEPNKVVSELMVWLGQGMSAGGRMCASSCALPRDGSDNESCDVPILDGFRSKRSTMGPNKDTPLGIPELDCCEDLPRGKPIWDKYFKEYRFFCKRQYVDEYMCRIGCDLQGFRLRCYVQAKVSRVKDWITKAVARNVGELDIYLCLPDSKFTIHAAVFSATSSVSAVKLELRFEGSFTQYRFNVPRLMLSAPNLKTLEFIRIKFPKWDAKRELSLCCLVLETLS
ncbi:hypothetical protein Sjap_026156 [Stephania japonica]|uniref:Uncharacterized protein n=1 Tax=Stephania japonica TaxID=461633 RepID=A0AAP0E5K5_9MAGN